MSSLGSTMKPLNHHESQYSFWISHCRASLWKIFFTHDVCGPWSSVFICFWKMVNSQHINNNFYNLTHTRTHKTQFKNGQKNWTEIFPKKIQMASHMIKYSTSLIFRKYKTKTTMRYHLTSQFGCHQEHKYKVLAKKWRKAMLIHS